MDSLALRLLGIDPQAISQALGIPLSSSIWIPMSIIAMLVSYPVIWYFLRRAKNIPVRFNPMVCLTVIAVTLLPALIAETAITGSLDSVGTTSLLFATESFNQGRSIVCFGDYTKVSAQDVQAAKEAMASASPTWYSPVTKQTISANAWMIASNPCGYQPVGLINNQHAAADAIAQLRVAHSRCMIAVGAVGVIAFFAIFWLVTSEIESDLRTAGQTQRVPLTKIELGVISVLFAVACFPFSLFLMRLFRADWKKT